MVLIKKKKKKPKTKDIYKLRGFTKRFRFLDLQINGETWQH